jgi:hypothetical protein
VNYFAHAYPFLHDEPSDAAFPYFLAGTAVPDWLTVCDRHCRVRAKIVEDFFDDADPVTAAVARGAVQHIRDDTRFHESQAFVESMVAMTTLARRVLGSETGFRPAFLGHLLVEVLLDAELTNRDPHRLDRYYRLLDQVDPAAVEAAVNRMAARPAERLAWFITHYRDARILWDYLDDAKLLGRLNQVMRRVGFERLPEGMLGVLPEARRLVAGRADDLLTGRRNDQ